MIGVYVEMRDLFLLTETAIMAGRWKMTGSIAIATDPAV